MEYKRDFVDVLEQLADGQVNHELGAKFRELVQAVEETGKAGRMTVTLKVGKQGTMAMVSVDHKITKPEPGTPSTILYFAKDGNLVREDPRQLQLRRLAEPAFDPRDYKPAAVKDAEEAVDRRADERLRAAMREKIGAQLDGAARAMEAEERARAIGAERAKAERAHPPGPGDDEDDGRYNGDGEEA